MGMELPRITLRTQLSPPARVRSQSFFASQHIKDKPQVLTQWQEYQQALSAFTEKGKALELPDREQIPQSIQQPLLRALNRVSPKHLKHLIDNNHFGIGEEAGDLIYHIGALVGMDTGIFASRRLKQFVRKNEDVIHNASMSGFNRLVANASEAIGLSDVKKMQPYFNLPDTEKNRRLLHQFLTVMMVAYTVYAERGFQTDFEGQVHAKTGLQSELHELAEHFAKRDISRDKLKAFNEIPNDPQAHRRWVEHLMRVTRQAIGTPKISLAHAIEFATWKCMGRAENLYRHPGEDYDTSKHKAKAWEKLFEAAAFLRDMKPKR